MSAEPSPPRCTDSSTAQPPPDTLPANPDAQPDNVGQRKCSVTTTCHGRLRHRYSACRLSTGVELGSNLFGFSSPADVREAGSLVFGDLATWGHRDHRHQHRPVRNRYRTSLGPAPPPADPPGGVARPRGSVDKQWRPRTDFCAAPPLFISVCSLRGAGGGEACVRQDWPSAHPTNWPSAPAWRRLELCRRAGSGRGSPRRSRRTDRQASRCR